MTDEAASAESQKVADATAYLETRGIPGGAREFRLRQEFFRHGWNMRVRKEETAWTVNATKRDRPDATAEAATEGDSLRLALADALASDNAVTGPEKKSRYSAH